MFDVKTHEYRVGSRTYILYNDAADTLLSGSLTATHEWEPWQLFLYSKLIAPSAVCFDIGGNIGTSAIAMAQYAPDGKVFSFEPVLPTFEILQRNLSENAIPNVFAFNTGISNVPGDREIYCNRMVLGGASQLTESVGRELNEIEFVQTMRMERLDDWRRAHSAPLPDLIKVDVEGFEKAVLEGGEEAFFQSPSTLAIFEFAIAPQRRAADSAFPGPQGDAIFLDLLLQRYRYVFLVQRNGRLYQITSYGQLRTVMLGGFPVDDLLCCQLVPDAVKDLIDPGCLFSADMPNRTFHSPAVMLFGYNQYTDGWSGISHGLPGTRSAVFIGVDRPCRATLVFTRIHSSISRKTSHPILVATRRSILWTDPTDQDTSIELEIESGMTMVFLESEYALCAKDYLGNPNDPRTVGFRFDINLY
jgi:FkbM family methyltransferase